MTDRTYNQIKAFTETPEVMECLNEIYGSPLYIDLLRTSRVAPYFIRAEQKTSRLKTAKWRMKIINLRKSHES